MTQPFLTVVVPAYNCAPVLVRSLEAILASDLPRSNWELIVADDGSTDDTPRAAERFADRIVRVAQGPKGPGAARNAAVEQARGEVVVFVDADVCIAPATLRQFATLFRERPDLGAAFGAYDREPEAPGLVSQYRNLLHHYVHSSSPGPATTFWAGCGAVRRSAFVAVRGFDTERYRRPQIEDIELGYRLSSMGYPIVLAPEIVGKHLKRWTFRGGVVTDVRDRGVPWMQLLLERREIAAAGPLNLAMREKVFTVLAPVAILAAVAALARQSWMLAVLAALMTLVIIAGNAALLTWFAGVRGWGFAFAIIPLRFAYYALNACSAGWALLGHVLRSKPPSAPHDSKVLASRTSS